MSTFWWGLRAFALMLLLGGGTCVARAQEPIRRVLIINPNTSELPATTIITGAASTRLMQALGPSVEIYTEFLDLSRFPGSLDEERMARFMAEKYAGLKLDVVAGLGDALRFLARHREQVARGVPLVYCCIPPGAHDVPEDAVGLVSELDLARTMDLAALLQPEARHVVVISGASEFDREWEATARRQLAPYAQRYAFRYLAGLTMPALLEELRRLPRGTIVIVTSIFADGSGKYYLRPRDVVPDITTASTAPVYAPYDSYLERGIVGGYMDTFEGSGTALAELMLKIMAGEKPVVVSHHSSAYRVDWRQLQRWGMSEASLPRGSIVLFKTPSFWDQYAGLAVAAVAIFILQSAFVAFLLFERRRRLRAEGSLRKSEERMAFAAAAVNVGLWQYDIASQRLWVTDHCRDMFDIPRDGPLARESFLAVVHPDDLPGAATWIRDVAHSPSLITSEFRVVRKDGKPRWYLSRVQSQLNSNGEAVSVSGAFSDITARKVAESEADAQRQTLAHITRVVTMGELSGAIAHEINQPLTAVVANAQAARRMLGGQAPPIDEIGAALDDVVAAGNRAGDVIRRLRDMLRKGEHKSAPIRPNDLVRATLRLLRSEIVNRRISVQLDLADNLPATVGDEVQVQQVLINLLTNAMDAVTSPGAREREISIATVASRPDCVEVVVSDRGPGIEPGQQAKLLEPFYTTKDQGIGLGLTISKSIISAHGGVLDIANSPAGGVRASFTLPAG